MVIAPSSKSLKGGPLFCKFGVCFYGGFFFIILFFYVKEFFMDPLLGGALIGGGLDFIGGLIANDESQARAREQMRFQERMSSTAYQRATADMRKAGLNPMLAYMQGGAQGASGAAGEVSNVLEGASSSAREFVGRSLEMKRLEQDIKESQSRIELQDAQKDLAKTNERDISMEFGSRAVEQKMDQEMWKKLDEVLGSSELLKGSPAVGQALKVLLPFMLRKPRRAPSK